MKENDKEFIKKNIDLIRTRLKRRKTDRLLAEVEFSYKLKGLDGVFHGLSFNISSFGMGFLRDTILNMGENLLFNFKLNDENMVISGEVSRINGKETYVEFDLNDLQRENFIKLFNREILREKSTVFIAMKELKKYIE